MSTREQAIEAAARTLLDAEWVWHGVGPQKHAAREHYSADCPLCRPDYADNAQRIVDVVAAVLVPALLDDIADRIAQKIDLAESSRVAHAENDAFRYACYLVRAAADGWSA